MSSPMGQFLFDDQMLAAVEQREQDSSQQALVSQIARGLAFTGHGARIRPRSARKSESHANSLGHHLSVEFVGLDSQVLLRLWRSGDLRLVLPGQWKSGGAGGAPVPQL